MIANDSVFTHNTGGIAFADPTRGSVAIGGLKTFLREPSGPTPRADT